MKTRTQLLTTEEAAERLRRPAGTLVWWRAVGKGPDTVKLHGQIRYDEADLERFIDSGRRVYSVQANREKKRGALQTKA